MNKKITFRYDESRYESAKKQQFQECMEYCLEHTYGQTLLNTELCRLLGYNINDEHDFMKFKSMMGRIKHELINRGKVLKSVRDGYYILKPQHVTSHCYRNYMRRSQRTLDKSLYVLNHIDTTELHNDRKEEYNNFKELNEKLSEMTEKMINNSKYYNRMDYYNSIND